MDIRREPVFESEGKRNAPTLSEFAKNSQITEDKVWELIEEGQVSARFINEAILIMQDHPALEVSKPVDFGNNEPSFSAEPEPLADFIVNDTPVTKSAPKLPSFLEKSFKVVEETREEKLFQDLDFIEDSHELLTFAQDALSRNAELSKELLATKNELIRLKDERIAFLSDLLNQKDKEIRSLNRNIEELATLSKFESR
jgi:hypothetical protein